MTESIVVGIDLGTTYSAVAYVDDRGVPRVLPNADGKTTTPSVVLVQDGRVVVGEAAVNQWIINEEHVVRWIKRAMGDPEYRFQGLSAVDLSAEILKALKRDAEAALGRPVTEAVVTCPAYFASYEVECTKRAGELAGLHVREVVKEPTAAAVFYGVENMNDGETVLVCDLGGGTFDATILTYRGGVFSPRASMGSRKLGGHDWTMDLVALTAERMEARLGEDPRNDLTASQALYEACERAKRDFARTESVSVTCPFRGRAESETVSRAEFEARTEGRILELVSWCEQALTKADPPLTWAGVDRVLLVGGSSRLRRMTEALAQASGKSPVQVREPDLAVAYGAAILAKGKVRPRRGGLTDGVVGGLIEVVAERALVRDLGMRVVASEGTPRVVSSGLIARGTVLPTSCSQDDYEVASDGQEYFETPVVEFEDPEASDYELVGNFRFRCPAGVRRGDRIRVTFSYDVSGIASVQAVHLRTGQELAADRQMTYKDPDPAEVRVEARPRWVVFTVDVSYSMGGDKLNNAKKGLIANARRLLDDGRSGCKVGVVAFGSDARVVCKPTANFAEVERAAASLDTTGSTAMDKGILAAVALAAQAPRGTDRDVVLLTDGMPDDKGPTDEAARAARAKGVNLLALGVGSANVDEDYLKTLAQSVLVIDSAQGIEAAFGSLLKKAAQGRKGGLTDR